MSEVRKVMLGDGELVVLKAARTCRAGICLMAELGLYLLARVAITEYHRLGIKQQKFIFSWFWRLEVQDEGCSRRISPGVSCLIFSDRWPLSCCVLTCAEVLLEYLLLL
jgi:hypothetical protein